ncbi:acetyl-CoA carboxylase biotin carboxyl carrier protein subunit [Siminovitchia sediminis]|uniref:Acetyl-CoA carboxylase biotin carboxyl carrier protein subunit n=1 Tax=Siminovitchia sediminis TaxID=1274353 RepID=A0ABW4KC59_9BACI
MKEILATMAGTVWKIEVSPGENISAGQTVLILESMKMEIPIESQEAGTIKEVNVSTGDFVNEGDILFILE